MKSYLSRLLPCLRQEFYQPLPKPRRDLPVSPTGPNSGAGIQECRNKSGPAVGPGSSTSNQQTRAAGQDASKVQGLKGNKSGPAVKSPSSK